MQGIFKRTAITDTVVMKRLCFNSLWLQRKQTELAHFPEQKLSGGSELASCESAGRTSSLRSCSLHLRCKDIKSAISPNAKVWVKDVLVVFKPPGGGGCSLHWPASPLFASGVRYSQPTSCPRNAHSSPLSHTWHHCWFLSVFLHASWVPPGQKIHFTPISIPSL